MSYDKVPLELRASSRWVLWRLEDVEVDGKIRKRSKSPKRVKDSRFGASSMDPDDWASFPDALAAEPRLVSAPEYAAEPNNKGIGLVIAFPFVGVDLDDCYDPATDKLLHWAEDFIEDYLPSTYSEYSPSRRGLHFWYHCADSEKLTIKGINQKPTEAYAKGRYFTVTGDQVPESLNEVARISLAQADAIFQGIQARKDDKPQSVVVVFGPMGADKRQAVWDGNWQAHYPSASNAVRALVGTIAIETGADPEATDRQFRLSKMYSETHWKKKWERLKTDEISKAIENARRYLAKLANKDKAPKKEYKPLVAIDHTEYIKKDIKERKIFLCTQRNKNPLFYQQSVNQIFAWRGTGKTMLAIALAGAMASGEKFLSWEATQKCKVLYVEGEMPAKQIQDRFKQLINGSVEPGYLRLVTLDFQEDNFIPPIATAEGRKLIENALMDAEVLILDSISTLANIATNDEEFWLDIQTWFRGLRSRGLCVVFLHHAGKENLQRGHSRSEDQLDLSIKMSKPEDYQIPDGLRCILEFDKTRGVSLIDGGRMEVKYDDVRGWLFSYTDDERKREAFEYLSKNPNVSVRVGCKALDLPRSTFHRFQAEFKARDVMGQLGNDPETLF